MTDRIGVFLCQCGTNVAETVDLEAVARFAESLDGVEMVRDCRFLCAESGQRMIQDDITQLGLTKVVVAACSPLLHETTFRQACASGGLNPFNLQIANIREQVSWITPDRTQATVKGKALVAAAVRRVEHHSPLKIERLSVTPRVLVVGAGIAGIEAALRLADAGRQVVLVEREPSIGGVMAMLDRTFPTLDCAACSLVPKMAHAAEHPNIELLTCCEVEAVHGHVGSFRVDIRRRPRYVNAERCNGCGQCTEHCPWADTWSEFEQKLGKRGAIYFPHAQAVPHTPVIDPAVCAHFVGETCEVCRTNCTADAIDFTQAEEHITVEVGAVVLATGFEAFDPTSAVEFGFGRWPNILTSLQFERLCHPTGPTGGQVLMANGKPPRSIAILHCVGSRSTRYNRHCSRICCTTALKLAITARRRTGAKVFSFYMDMRAAGKGCEEFYEQAQRSGVVFTHGRGTEVISRGGHLLVKAEDTVLGRRVIVPVDMAVLMVGMQARADAGEVARRFGITCGPAGFFMEKHVKFAPVETTTPGIFVAGACQGPRDISETVAQASAAAAGVLGLLDRASVDIMPTVAVVDQARCGGCRLCLADCPYDAIDMLTVDGRDVARVAPVLCRSCGSCATICPAAAITQLGYSREQLNAEISGLLSVVG